VFSIAGIGDYFQGSALGFPVLASSLSRACSLSNCIVDLPGDIGGQMGLFIGASILTILELFDYAYEVRHRTHTM
jgi:hypothetical protein